MEKDGDIIELSDKDLADMGLYINRKTLQVTELKNKGIMQPMDIEEGSYFEDYAYISHAKVQKICTKLDYGSITADHFADYIGTLCGFKGYVATKVASVLMSLGSTTLENTDKGKGIMVKRLNTNYQIFTVVAKK